MHTRALLFLIAFTTTLHSQKPEPIKLGTERGIEQLLFGQKVEGETLTLLPEHCFFSGAGGAKLAGEKPSTDELNGNKSWSSIEGLKSPDQQIVFPLQLNTGGELKGKIEGSGKFSVKLGEDDTAGSGTFHFKKVKQGRADLILSPQGNASVTSITLTGSALRGAELLRARWRPLAVHSNFSSSQLKGSSRMWVMEVRPIYGEKGYYCPIVTPFGYFGSTVMPDHTSGGINFSMWSYQAGEAEPPMPQLSHLLAVGSPQATFGGYDHEGTGVKLKGWNPYEGQRISTTVLALRIDSDPPYDTYTGYFLDQTTRTWRFFASGRKWVGDKPVASLQPSCFLEVPGPPHIERSGHIARGVDFRGWMRDSKGDWHPVDAMNASGADTSRDQSSGLWMSTPDGWFRMATGGMVHYRYPGGVNASTKPSKYLPDYMAPELLKVIEQLPTQITVKRIARQGSNLQIEVELITTAKDRSKVKICYGDTDALTFEQRWQHRKDLGQLTPGVQRLTIDNAPTSGFCRVLVTNETGSYFTSETSHWK